MCPDQSGSLSGSQFGRLETVPVQHSFGEILHRGTASEYAWEMQMQTLSPSFERAVSGEADIGT